MQDDEINSANVERRATEHELDLILQWLRQDHTRERDGSFWHNRSMIRVVCGDRHWQYHSVHTATGLNEFSVGAASDQHAGGTPGEDKEMHCFHRVKGGFLSMSIRPDRETSKARFELRDVSSNVVYTWEPM